MSAHFPQWLEWIGVAVFALSGALTAARKRMDPFGFAFLAAVTGVGGGTLRDVLLGRPVAWVIDPTSPAICVIVGLAAFIVGARFAPANANFTRPLLFADAGRGPCDFCRQRRPDGAACGRAPAYGGCAEHFERNLRRHCA